MPLGVDLRETGDLNGPTNHVCNRVSLSTATTNQATFTATGKRLLLTRKYALVFRPDSALLQ